MRRALCLDCPFNSINARESEEYKELFGKNYDSSLNYFHCSICACPIQRKTACLSCECGLTDWNEHNPDNQKPLKWNKYEPSNTRDNKVDVINDNKR